MITDCDPESVLVIVVPSCTTVTRDRVRVINVVMVTTSGESTPVSVPTTTLGELGAGDVTVNPGWVMVDG